MRDGHRIQNSKLLQVAYNDCIYKQSLARCYVIIGNSSDRYRLYFVPRKIVWVIVKVIEKAPFSLWVNRTS